MKPNHTDTMAKDPAFLFYPNDWLGGTMGMTFEEKGAYMELLMLQFNRGHMTKDMIGQTVGQLWPRIEDKFKVDANGLFYNERLDLEKEKRKNYTQSRRNNVLGKHQHDKKQSHMKEHMTSHMEDVIVNEIVSVIKKEKRSERTFLPPTINEVINYFIQNGFSEALARRVYESYHVADWHDSQGKKIKNWKQKCLQVWFKESNKEKPEEDKSKVGFYMGVSKQLGLDNYKSIQDE